MKKLFVILDLETILSMENENLGFLDFNERSLFSLENLNLNGIDIQNELEY
jgi:hypothetical protein